MPSGTATHSWPTPPSLVFHGLVGDIVRAIEPHSETDPIALLIQSLVCFGNIIGRQPYYVVEAERHYTNMNTCLVGQTSKSRKGTSWAQIRHLFDAADAEWTDRCILSGLSSGEGLIWQVRDPISADPGIPDKRLLVTETEFASVLKVLSRDTNTLSPAIRNAWDHGDLRIMTKNSPAKATGAHISIIGHITLEELRRHMTGTEIANGFANRFLWLCVRRSKMLPEGGQMQEVDFQPLVQRLTEAVEFARQAEALGRDEAARALWYEVYPTLSEGKPGLLGAVCGRAEAQVLRLSCLYALLDSSTIIRLEHLRAALALWNYAEDSARYIFGDSLGDPVANALLQVLRHSPSGMTRTAIHDYFKRHCRADEIHRALVLLQTQNLVRSEQKLTRGRPAEVWLANAPNSGETAAPSSNNSQTPHAPHEEDNSLTSHTSQSHPG